MAIGHFHPLKVMAKLSFNFFRGFLISYNTFLNHFIFVYASMLPMITSVKVIYLCLVVVGL